jgi:AraC-like DNA-binding protein
MASEQVVRQVEERLQMLRRRPTLEEGWGDYIVMLLRVSERQQLTLDDIAVRLNVSARTIDRNLKKENLTFRQLSQQVQLERARELLAVPGATVATVAEQLGFSDTANFTRAFRRMAGMSPSAFQESAGTESPASPSEPSPGEHG